MDNKINFFSEKLADNMEKLKNFAKKSKYIPTANSILKAGVSAIPTVGGALGHLIFDKADEIRIRNIEIAIEEISSTLKGIDSQLIDVNWFSSPEALNVFKSLVDKVQFESESSKTRHLATVFALFGTKQNVAEPNKYIILEKLASLTITQIHLFTIVARTPYEERTMSQGALIHDVRAIWFDSIKAQVLDVPKFWSGTMNLDLELEILVSLNLIKLHPSPIKNMTCFQLSGIGHLLEEYLTKK